MKALIPGDMVLAWLHFVAIFTTGGLLIAERALLRPALVTIEPRRLARVDLGYFIAVIAVVATGLARAFFGPKGWSYYASNPMFWTKIGLFVAVGIISIGPTRAFLRWRRAEHVPADAVRSVARIVAIELALLALVPLAAVLLARGVGA